MKRLQYAQSKGLPGLQYHLIPKTKAFSSMVLGMKEGGRIIRVSTVTVTSVIFTQLICHHCLMWSLLFLLVNHL